MVRIGSHDVDNKYFERLVKRCEDKIRDEKGRIIKDRYGCWLWERSKDKDGFGMISLKKNGVRAVNVFWLNAGCRELKKGEYLKHTCKNKSCVNPAHLYIQLGKPREKPPKFKMEVPTKNRKKIEKLFLKLRSPFNLDDVNSGRHNNLRFNILQRTILDLFVIDYRSDALTTLNKDMWFCSEIGVSCEWVREQIIKSGLKI